MMTGNTRRPPKILLILIKNFSPLDYALPILWKIKRLNPAADVSVLYCVTNRKKILREARFYSDILDLCSIPEYDFMDFLDEPYASLDVVWRRVFSRSDRDSSSLIPPGPRPLQKITRRVERYLRKTESLLYARMNPALILPRLDPDVILFDNRSVTRFAGREHFYDYFDRAGKKVILMPHAPHHTGTQTFTPFDEQGDALPDYCEYWMPFRFDRCWENVPEKKEQFVYVGYPGFDSEWLSWLQTAYMPTKTARRDGPLRCAFIIRKFLEKGRTRPPGHDALIFNYEEFSYYLNLIGEAFRRSGEDIELVVKPHPSNDFRSVAETFDASPIPKWSITHESIYNHLSDCDFIISLYSTTMLIPAMAGIPVILLHSRVQDEIHQWEEMEQMYTGLSFYLHDPDTLPDRLGEVLEIARRRRESDTGVWDSDVNHLRYFYPDGAIQNCIDRIGIFQEA